LRWFRCLPSCLEVRFLCWCVLLYDHCLASVFITHIANMIIAL
jgi:hypothetical protein